MYSESESFQLVAWYSKAPHKSENEKELGEAIRASGIPRDEIYIVTKLEYVSIPCQ